MTNNFFLQQMRKKKKPKQIVTGNVPDKKKGRIKNIKMCTKILLFQIHLICLLYLIECLHAYA